MAWTHIQDTPGGNAFTVSTGNVTSLSAAAFTGQPVIGNFIIVAVMGLSSGINQSSLDAVGCTDNAITPNRYSQLFYSNAFDGANSRWTAVLIANVGSLPSAGNLVPRALLVNVSSNVAIAASEFGGGSTSPEAHVINATTATTTTPTPGAITTNATTDLVISAIRTDGSSTTITGQANFTSIAISQAPPASVARQFAYFIPAALLTNFNPPWTLTTAAGYSAGQVALFLTGNPQVPRKTYISTARFEPALLE